MSSSNCCFLTCIHISQEAGHRHTVTGFGILNKAEVDVSLELSCFFNDWTDIGNLISGSSVFSESSLNIWKFSVHVLLKPGLENFEHYFCVVVWTFFSIKMKTDLFQSCGHCWVFQICWHIECSTFTASSFRVWNSSTGIPSPPLAQGHIPRQPQGEEETV